MTLSQTTLIDIRSTCNEIVSNLDAIKDDPTITGLDSFARTLAECAASVQTLADMVRTLAEEAARG